MNASRHLIILLLISTIGFVTIAPVKSGIPLTFDVTTSTPCACSTSAVYTFHIENSAPVPVTSVTVTIPAGYQINPLYLTTTAGIVVATGVYGDIAPPSSGNTLVLKTTATSGIFQIIDNSVPNGVTGALTLPTQTTSGLWVIFTSIGANIWVEVSFVAGFLTNPCTLGTYTWSPVTAMMRVGESQIVIVQTVPRLGFSDVVTTINCARPVAGVLMPTSKLEILTPYLALAGLVIAVSAVVVVKKRSKD